MRAFCPSKTRPFDIPSKIKYMERGSLHLAMILRKRGRDKEAVEQLLPFIAAARKLLEDITKHNYHYYSQTFTEIYSALGKDKEAWAFFAVAHTYSRRVCEHCHTHCSRHNQVAVCECCFCCSCSKCMSLIQLNPIIHGSCVPGQILWSVSVRRIHPRGVLRWKRRNIFGELAVELMTKDHARNQ